MPDLTEPLQEAHSLIDDEVITKENFKAYAFENPHRLYTEANADFFKGMPVEAKVKSAVRA